MREARPILRGDDQRFIWSIVAAQVLVQIGAFSLPALLPGYIAGWNLSKTEAGSLIGIFFAAYVVAVPVLVSLTDNVPTRWVYAAGAGLTAASHLGNGLPRRWILVGAAVARAWIVMPQGPPAHARGSDPRALLDFRPVLRNRPVAASIAGYTVHTWEMAALRAWGVTFLTTVAARSGSPSWLPAPPTLLTIAGFAGIAVSIFGNEIAQRIGRIRVVAIAVGAAAVLALGTGWAISASMPVASALVIAWLAAIFLDSSALTAGTVQAADPALRGATMGLHSMCGSAGGFIGPLGVGLALDLAGDNLTLGWGLGFGPVAIVTLLGYAVLTRLARGGDPA